MTLPDATFIDKMCFILQFFFQIDSNLVWSSKSFVPRSATLNLTMDVFGESLNLFELGGRVEGLEYLLEAYFGPTGYFKNSEKSSDSVSPSDPRPAKLSSNKLDAVHKQVSFMSLIRVPLK